MSYSAEFRDKMAAEGLHEAFIEGWLQLYEKFCNGDKGFIPESAIEPVTELPELESLPEADEGLLAKTVILKLNGGLGTGMGLDKAKSLLEVKDGDTFLDLIAKQILKLREKYPVRFMLMNSFSTEEDTKDFFVQKYPEIAAAWDTEVSFMQNMSPKVDAETKQPVSWPAKPSAEWCPPGHGDIYAALVCSGKLDQLIADGYEYLFVSNSDNLGATMDLRLLGYLAETGSPMLMEVCVRGEDDKKGGHLARQVGSGILTLRESAQCPKEDEKAFQDIGKHKFFNTNNLWLNLLHLRDAMVGGVMPLPIIVNEKKVDPSSKDDPGPKVYQLETAMGAAISSMPGSQAICVPFSRFAPVKTCNQLFALRSDAYVIDEEFKPVLAPGACKPVVDFDDNYKMVPDMQAAIPQGVPSLKQCKKVMVRGKVIFAANVVIIGDVSILNGDTSGPPPTITGTIRGSSDKLRILRDADDVQSHVHVAGQPGGAGGPQTARVGYVSRTMTTGTAVGFPTYRTSMATPVPASSINLSNTMPALPVRALPTAPGVLASANIPQVVKTIQAPVRQVIAPQVAPARSPMPMPPQVQVISTASPAPIVAPQIIAATAPAASPAAAPIAYSKAGPSWVAPPRYVMAAQPTVKAVTTARS